MEEKNIEVSIIMGSKSDWDVMQAAQIILDEFKISNEARVLSAHRTPEDTVEYIKEKESSGLKLIIAGAGFSAHLAGVCAAHTTLPVLGVPIDSSPLSGFDSLLSTVQMPAGIPVATFGVGKSGAKNAAFFAVSILSANNPQLRLKIKQYRETQADLIRRTVLN